MSTEQNLKTIQDVYAAFTRGDVPFILESLSDELKDFSVISDGPTKVPWHQHGRGKASAVTFFETLGKTADFQVFEPRDYAASGDHVYVTLHMEAIVRATGKPLVLDEVMHHWTFDRDGKIVRWRATEDTAQSARAFS